MTSSFAALPMYPVAGLRDAWDELYSTIASSVGERYSDTPLALDWTLDSHDGWRHPHLALSQACGWPLITELRNSVRVLGAFEHLLDGAASHMYCSVIVARSAHVPNASTDRAAINSADSLSGCVSLHAAFGFALGQWPGEVVLTGSHLASIDAVRGGSADVASIDALSWAYQQHLDPNRLDGLVVVQRGPLVPCLPLIVGGEADDALVAAWRSAFSAAMSNPSLARVRSLLLIEGFVPLDLADYQRALATLAGAAAVHSDTRTLGRTKET